MIKTNEKENIWGFEPLEIKNGACIELLEYAVPPFSAIDPISGVFAIIRAKCFSPLPKSGGMYVVYVPEQELSATPSIKSNFKRLRKSVDNKFKKDLRNNKSYDVDVIKNKTPCENFFLNVNTKFRIVAYIDMFGRVFAVDNPIFAPPARIPDVWFESTLGSKSRLSGGFSSGNPDSGIIRVVDWKSSRIRNLAEFDFSKRNGFSIKNSWYWFNCFSSKLTYEQALARCYLAFSLRPALGAPTIPDYSTCREAENYLLNSISEHNLFSSLAQIVFNVEEALKDDMLCVPGIIQLFVQNIQNAGLVSAFLRHVTDKDAYLLRNKPYSHDYYIMEVPRQTTITPREMWGIEGVINRFDQMCYSSHFSTASFKECEQKDARLVIPYKCPLSHLFPKTFDWDHNLSYPLQLKKALPELLYPEKVPFGVDGGEWNARVMFATAVERMRFPLRVGVDFRLDWNGKTLALGFMAPSDTMMPAARNDKKLAAHQAQIYAQSVGVVLASHAFEIIPRIQKVSVFSHILPEDGADTRIPPAYYSVEFSRDLNLDLSELSDIPSVGEPYQIFKVAGAKFNVDGITLPNTTANQPMFESWGGTSPTRKALPSFAYNILGAKFPHDLDVEYNTNYRSRAEAIADKLTEVKTISDAINIVSAIQESDEFTSDSRAQLSCTRLMEALAKGKVETNDPNAVVSAFLGNDRCSTALKKARKLQQTNPEKALDILTTSINETQLLDGVCDTSTTVYRFFDGYTSRVLYNLSRIGKYSFVPKAGEDAGKKVLPAPDAYFACYLEAISLLERSFDSTEEALRYAVDLVKFAPATSQSHRELARIYALMGDFSSALKVLYSTLGMLHQNDEISLTYYQLGYVLWKTGKAEAGCACYMKALESSHIVAMECAMELQKLIAEAHININTNEKANKRLVRAGVKCVPSKQLLDVVDKAAAAASDLHLDHVARGLLTTRLQYRQDNVLVDVLSSYA